MNPKKNETINYFDLELTPLSNMAVSQSESVSDVGHHGRLQDSRYPSAHNQRTGTNSFDRLIDEYIQLVQDDLLHSPLSVKGLGTKTYKEFFRPHQTISYNIERFILFGNLARFTKVYGNGSSICLYFFDVINEKKGVLYINFENYDDIRRKDTFIKAITELKGEQIKFFQAFFIATDRIEKTYQVMKNGELVNMTKYEYVIPNLNYLRIIKHRENI